MVFKPKKNCFGCLAWKLDESRPIWKWVAPFIWFWGFRHPQLDLEDHPGGVPVEIGWFCEDSAICGSQNMPPYNQRPYFTILELFLSSWGIDMSLMSLMSWMSCSWYFQVSRVSPSKLCLKESCPTRDEMSGKSPCWSFRIPSRPCDRNHQRGPIHHFLHQFWW